MASYITPLSRLPAVLAGDKAATLLGRHPLGVERLQVLPHLRGELQALDGADLLAGLQAKGQASRAGLAGFGGLVHGPDDTTAAPAWHLFRKKAGGNPTPGLSAWQRNRRGRPVGSRAETRQGAALAA